MPFSSEEAFDDLYWKLYREERRKLVKAKDPSIKKPFQVVLTGPEIVRVAHEARRRRNESRS